MQLTLYPERVQWSSLLQRPVQEPARLEKAIREVLTKVKANGDEALRSFTRDFDGVDLTALQVSEEEIETANSLVSPALKQAIETAKNNIETFHSFQVIEEPVVAVMPGVKCWRRAVGIEKVGLYIPGGTAPLFSTVLMLGVPATLAGCKEIILCTPPQKDGSVHPAILFAAQLAGITKIFKVGGAQAIAAMAYGTETIPKVFKIFGPGNQYVNGAKQLVQAEQTAIDMPAGPSEVCVLADDSANAAFIAADLLSQAEHGPDSQVLLVTTSADLASAVQKEIEQQVAFLPREVFAQQSLSNSRAIVLQTMDEAIELVNQYAAEHLIIACNNEEEIGGEIINAGSVFLGNYSPESAGDYASGTNHTLPTNGFAGAYSGVSVDSFVKKITYQQLTKDGLRQLAPVIEEMAVAEGLEAHANAVRVRLK
ncbi:MAG: histidinol dehydrogenase [Citrobacter freundii]|nr:MAG: histidinol dehydrogenase [Citrobacter freundii]